MSYDKIKTRDALYAARWLTQPEVEHSELEEQLAESLVAAAQEIERLEQENKTLSLDVKRSALHWANLTLHLDSLKRKVEAFICGVTPTEWKSHEPRIVGFRLEFDAMVEAMKTKEPELPTREQIEAIEKNQT